MRRLAGLLILVLTVGLVEAAAQNRDGMWRGTTSQNQVLGFTVRNQAVVDVDFRFVTSDDTTGTLTGAVAPQLNIVNGSFSGSAGVCFVISGLFTSGTSANGSMTSTGDAACSTLRAVSFTWSASLVAIPENDNFSAALLIDDSLRTISGANVGATTQTGEPQHGDIVGATSSVWWKWIAPVTGTMTFDTEGSDFDTVLAVYEGTSLPALRLVISNDDFAGAVTSRVTFSVVGGNAYLVAVGGLLGQTGSIRLNWISPRTTSRQFTIPDRGNASSSSTGATSLRIGSVSIEPSAGSSTPAGLEILGFRQNNVLVSETGLSASPAIRTGRTYVEIGGAVGTAMAFANPNPSPVDLTFSVQDIHGVAVANGTTRISPNGQIATYLTDAPFNIRLLSGGTLTFTASSPVSAVAVRMFTNERNEILITALPVLDLSLPAASLPDTLPQIVDGGGWKTDILLLNPTDQAVSGTVQFMDRGSSTAPPNPMIVTVEGSDSPADIPNSAFRFSIGPRGMRRLQTSGNSAPLQTGLARILLDGGSSRPLPVALLSARSNGITVMEAAIGAASSSSLRMYAESTGDWGQAGSIRSALAITNSSLSAVTVSFELSGSNGSILRTGLITIAGGSGFAGLVNQIPGFESLPPQFTGTLKVSTAATASITVAGFRCRYNERGDFLVTNTPPFAESRSGYSTPNYFAHFADGAGFTTQFILFGTTLAQPTAGSMWFYDPAGRSIAPPLR